MIKGWRHRFSFVRAIRPLLRTVLVYRPALSVLGEPDYEALSFVYRGLGYRFYKFERITSHLSIPGRIARERTQRILLPYPAAAQGQGPTGALRTSQRFCLETCVKRTRPATRFGRYSMTMNFI